jgi:hypothetical protein
LSPTEYELRSIRGKIARAMVGRSAALLATTRRITHGVITAVLTDAGAPKLIVNGASYDLNQVLAVYPNSLN